MQYKPNDKEMEVGEKYNATFKHSLGTRTIAGDPTVTCSGGLTVETAEVEGSTIVVPVTATTVGSQWLKVAATLSSAEVIGGVVRINVIDSTTCGGSRDYE